MPQERPDMTIIHSPSGAPLDAAFVACGGAGCKMLADGLLPDRHLRIAIGPDPKAMDPANASKVFVASPGELESDALVSAKSARLAGSELERELAECLVGRDIVFMVAGLGGLSGGWGAVVGARAARVARTVGVCVASAPFSVEGPSRRERASAQLRALSATADASLVIQNDMILAEAPKLPINSAFRVMNGVMASPIGLMLRCFGKDDLGMLERHFSLGRVMAMDSAEWDRENAEFAVAEALGKSKWLGLEARKPKSAILFVEGRCLHGDMEELGRLFLRAAGGGCGLILANAGERKEGLRVIAAVGF